MKKNILYLLSLTIVILSFLAFFSVKEISCLIIELIILLALIYLFIKCKDDDFIYRKRWKMLIMLFLNIIFICSQVLYLNNNSNLSISYIVTNSIIGIIIFMLINRTINFNYSILAFILLILNIPLLFSGVYSPFFTFAIVILFYSCMSLSYEYVYSKRNILKYLLISLTTILLINEFYLFIVPIFLFLISMYRNINKKKIMIIYIFFLISMFGLYWIINIYDINEMLFTNNMTYTMIFVDYSKLLLFTELIISSLLSFYSIKKYNDINYKYILYCQIFIILLLIFEIYYNRGVFAPFVYLVSIYLVYQLFIINTKKNPIKIPYYKRYIKDRNIKKVSVVIPNYNYGKYIEQRIDSVINQTYPIFELIILDDKSSDNSVDIIKKKVDIIKNNIKVSFIPNEKNSGSVFKQWEKAFEESKGDYLWIAEADDLCDKHFLNVVMKGFKDNDVVLSYCESSAMNENGEIYKKDMRDWVDLFNTKKFNRDYINDGKIELEEVLCTNNTIVNASAVVFNKNKIKDVKKHLKIAQKYKLAGDWYFYVKTLQYGKIAYFCDSLNYHRIHKDSVTTVTDNRRRYKEVISVQKTISQDINLSENAKKRVTEYNDNLKKACFISDDIEID